MKLLGAVILLANGAAAWRLAGAAADETLFSYPLMLWTLRGMEVGLVALLVTVMAWQTVRLQHPRGQPHGARRALGVIVVCMILALLTRPDAIVVVLVTGLLAVRARPSGGPRWRTALVIASVISGVMMSQTLWRVLYFGDPLPNTYYLKMTGLPVAERIRLGFRMFATLTWRYHFWLPLLILVLGLPMSIRRPKWGAVTLLLAGLPLAMMSYSIYVGGDAWEEYGFPNRYIAIILPVLFVYCSRATHHFVEKIEGKISLRSPGFARWCIIIALLLNQNFHLYSDWVEDGYSQQLAHESNTRLGLVIRAGTMPDAVVAVTWAGAVPYFSRREAIDLLGKNDRTIARLPANLRYTKPGHTKWDYQISLGDGRADVITILQSRTAEELKRLRDLRYRELPSNLYIRDSSPRVNQATLSVNCLKPDQVDEALAAAPYPWR